MESNVERYEKGALLAEVVYETKGDAASATVTTGDYQVHELMRPTLAELRVLVAQTMVADGFVPAKEG